MGAGGALGLTMARHHPTMPPVTQADLAEAWARYQACARGPGVPANWAQALAHRTLGPVLQASARKARTEAWLAIAERTVDLVPAVRLGTDGHPMAWQTRPGAAWHHAAAVDHAPCLL